MKHRPSSYFWCVSFGEKNLFELSSQQLFLYTGRLKNSTTNFVKRFRSTFTQIFFVFQTLRVRSTIFFHLRPPYAALSNFKRKILTSHSRTRPNATVIIFLSDLRPARRKIAGSDKDLKYNARSARRRVGMSDI